MSAYDYSFKGHTTTIGTEVVEDFGEGDGVSVARASAATSDTVGASGAVTVSRINDERADVTMILSRGSAMNALLYARHKREKQEQRTLPFSFLMLRDVDGEEILAADVMWIQQEPDQTFGAEAGSLTWVFRTNQLRQHEPGAPALEAQPFPDA